MIGIGVDGMFVLQESLEQTSREQVRPLGQRHGAGSSLPPMPAAGLACLHQPIEQITRARFLPHAEAIQNRAKALALKMTKGWASRRTVTSMHQPPPQAGWFIRGGHRPTAASAALSTRHTPPEVSV